MDVLLSGLARKYPENESIKFLVERRVALNFVLTGYITDAFETMPEAEFFPHLMSLLDGVVFFYSKYQDIEDQDLRVRTFHEDVNNIISRDLFGKSGVGDQILCSKGCSNCCSQFVTVSKSEAELLLKNASSVDLPRLQKQSLADLDSWTERLTESEGSCVFLNASNGACNVWSDRPANCRNYFVTGSNDHCSVFKRNPDISRSVKSILADVCITAFYSLDGGEQSLSHYLYERLK